MLLPIECGGLLYIWYFHACTSLYSRCDLYLRSVTQSCHNDYNINYWVTTMTTMTTINNNSKTESTYMISWSFYIRNQHAESHQHRNVTDFTFQLHVYIRILLLFQRLKSLFRLTWTSIGLIIMLKANSKVYILIKEKSQKYLNLNLARFC